MRRRVVARLTGALAASLLVLPAPARAESPRFEGWWSAGLVVLGIDLGVLGLPDPQVAAVPADGLLVAGGLAGNEPQAYAALSFNLHGGEPGGPLRLTLHPLGGSLPGSGALACPLDRARFEPARGAPLADAPAYDCLGGVPARVAPDGAYLFDVTTVQREGAVAVAIVPATPTSRLVFATPGDDALPLRAAAPVAPTPTPPTPPAPELAPPVVGLPVDVPSELPTLPVTTTSLPPARPEVAAPAASVTDDSSSGSATRAYVLLALAGVAAGGWGFAGRQRRSSGV